MAGRPRPGSVPARDVVLQLLDDELLLGDDVLDQVSDGDQAQQLAALVHHGQDRKSTRLNSSHLVISYAVFCLKKKKNHVNQVHKVLVHNSSLIRLITQTFA